MRQHLVHPGRGGDFVPYTGYHILTVSVLNAFILAAEGIDHSLVFTYCQTLLHLAVEEAALNRLLGVSIATDFMHNLLLY